MPGSPGTKPAPDLPPGPRLALVVATTTYTDTGLRRLRAPAQDAADLARVLGDRAIGGFSVTSVIDQSAQAIRIAVEEFLAERGTQELLLVYLSCHGLLDAYRRLFFAATDTRKDRLGSTGVEAAWVMDQLEHCRARRQILILDSCFSGAFAHGAKGNADLGLRDRFAGQGRGRVVLTASTATEYSFEGEPTDSATATGSVFTAALVTGLRTGAADMNHDGYISVDDAYAYAYDKVQAAGAAQTPQRWLYGAEGEIVLARSVAGIPSSNVFESQSAHGNRASAPAETPATPSLPRPLIPSRLVRTLTADTFTLQNMAFSPDGSLLVTGGLDGTVWLWDPAAGQHLRILEGHTGPVEALAFSPDGRLLASAGLYGDVRLWDPGTGQHLHALEGEVKALAFSPDGRLFGATTNSIHQDTVHVWDSATGEARSDVRLRARGKVAGVVMPKGDRKYVTTVLFSPDGRLLATCYSGGLVDVWDPATGQLLSTLKGHSNILVAVAFSADGSLILTGGAEKGIREKVVRLWDSVSGQHLRTFEASPGLQAVTFSPDGRLVAILMSDNRTELHLRNAATGQHLNTLVEDKISPVFSNVCMAFSPDGSLLAIAETNSIFDLDDLKRAQGHLDDDDQSYLEEDQDSAQHEIIKCVRLWG
jgi:WD40 repeat protein